MCACKGNSSRQVSSVKQIVKKPAQVFSNNKKNNKTGKRQIVFRKRTVN